MRAKKALVTGARGQTGSYISDLLLEKGYKVDGLVRRSGNLKLDNLKGALKYNTFNIIYGDISDGYRVAEIIKEGQYDEVYHAAAVSHVHYSFNHPGLNAEVNYIAVISFLENIKNFSPHSRFLLMSTSECWGNNYRMARSNINNLEGCFDGKLIKIQDESVSFNPRSPYGVSKAAASYIVDIYQKSYGLWVCAPICHNHESPRRGSDFLTAKVINYIGKLYRGEIKENLKLGNLEAVRDFSFAGDIARGLYLVMQQDNPATYVFCSGVGHSVREFVELAFKKAGYDWQDHVVISDKLFRPCEVDFLQGSYLKAKEELGWEPTIDFDKLVELMLEAEIGQLPKKIYSLPTIPDFELTMHDIVDIGERIRLYQTS